MYLVADVHKDGTIRVGPDASWSHVIHKESVKLPEKYTSCVSTLNEAKQLRDGDAIILQLDADGGVEATWMTDEQKERLVPLLNKWKGCYGLWPVRRLNE